MIEEQQSTSKTRTQMYKQYSNLFGPQAEDSMHQIDEQVMTSDGPGVVIWTTLKDGVVVYMVEIEGEFGPQAYPERSLRKAKA